MHVAGLVVFLVVVALDVAGLALDSVLLLVGAETITERVWACPALGLPIVALQAASVLGLIAHFYAARAL